MTKINKYKFATKLNLLSKLGSQFLTHKWMLKHLRKRERERERERDSMYLNVYDSNLDKIMHQIVPKDIVRYANTKYFNLPRK